MPAYMITYDLTDGNYDPLNEAIQNIDSNAIHPLESVWIIETNNNDAMNILSSLTRFINRSSKLLVVELSYSNAGCTGLANDIVDNLRKKLNP